MPGFKFAASWSHSEPADNVAMQMHKYSKPDKDTMTMSSVSLLGMQLANSH